MSNNKKYNPLNSKGLKEIPTHKRYPKSPGVKKAFSYTRKLPIPTPCEHDKVPYKNLYQLTKRAYVIMDRLSYLLVEKELQCEKLARYINNHRKNGGNNDL